MKNWVLIGVLFFISYASAGQQTSIDPIPIPVTSFSSEKFSSEENSLRVPWQLSQTNHQIETTGDTSFVDRTFGRKVWRAAKIIFCGELATMAFFAAMPQNFSNWNKNFYRNAPLHWKNAFTMPPKLDDDPMIVNYAQHPLAGAVYYNGVRSQGATPAQSFLFSVAESTFFEYFIESVAERPSIQDLIVTPIAGSLLGEIQYQATLLMKKNGFNFVEKLLVLFLNPMYVIFNGYRIRTPITRY